ncbi:NADP-dependent malic enzyme [Bradyrhizobium sp. U87765 SZCCT0131]|uniref:NADP-dependent malic enzyme n=1 Tax=unclassified Bradyrhizobium TaxID=2631580 RepID=UPI001BA7315F|nr:MULTISPECIES: NADP-dependent malic enzyme [unclassified Bradyrhizobium]MBR1220473.1 NADP-dependent malic enzyme [Bradyrhizobium sp. U87765 SZCCT0131]MBR1263072.1 NADP-dependent malic enzyme [Bradyrhizobium sp. U87765 SZCCT0134]MBR1307045.1 NADP-dependent malic enzyme [Bradyrhizobium sp. U87765 SZCCT0110]MBR1323067.1 NADP-dependent malic enzyme [Bradyrhizobium sp. U87765 SZCCT0109]MBR1345999.1 NADP-dependent malic enzyme [Bradyrhizobium sp. U87765 SZCCT0048]
MSSSNSEDLRSAALAYHRLPRPGKFEIQPIKPLANQRDLALAYSPGVAAACQVIAEDPGEAATLTIRSNLVAVVSNGTAVLGLGNIGPLASKPVMEGKAVLFKKFANIDVFDIEIAANTVDRVVETVAALEPTFGGINLEDIRAPECFEIEAQLKERMKIPVFHDDQHGTAIIVAAAVRNALALNGKKLEDVKIVTAGAGAAALACLNLLVWMGARRENVWVNDIDGLVHVGRNENMDRWKAVYAQKTDKRTLGDVIGGADIFLGLSGPNVLSREMVAQMAEKPLVLALANPTPEIMPDDVRAVRPDAMICTGRSDFPNQVNNVLCFPFIFRGALDVGATAINEEMKRAAVDAIAQLAREAPSDVVARSSDAGEAQGFGPGSLIPSPFDPRLILRIAPAVAKAAMESGVATRPITNFDEYVEQLERFTFRSGLIMKPVFAKAKTQPVRVIYAEGEDERILRATQVVLEEKLALPILVGRPSVVAARIERFGLAIRAGKDFHLVNPEDDPRYRSYVQSYIDVAGRRGITPDAARTLVRTNNTVIAALSVMRGEADAMICGVEGRYMSHLRHIREIIGFCPGADDCSALALMITSKGPYFIADTQVRLNPSAQELAEMAAQAAEHVQRFGLKPKIAFLSHSDFGSYDSESSRKMREATRLLAQSHPEIEADGEMQGDSALSQLARANILPHSRLEGVANVLIMPNLDAANIAYQMIKMIGDALPVGPILIGPARPAHILTPSVTARGVLNMTAVAVVEAQEKATRQQPNLFA